MSAKFVSVKTRPEVGGEESRWNRRLEHEALPTRDGLVSVCRLRQRQRLTRSPGSWIARQVQSDVYFPGSSVPGCWPLSVALEDLLRKQPVGLAILLMRYLLASRVGWREMDMFGSNLFLAGAPSILSTARAIVGATEAEFQTLPPKLGTGRAIAEVSEDVYDVTSLPVPPV